MPEHSPERPADLPPRARRAILACVVVLAAAGALGTAFSPYLLIKQPLALIALSPDLRHLVLVTGSISFTELLVVGTIRRIMALMATYGLGVVYGYAALRWAEQRYPRTAKLIRLMDGLFRRFGAPLLLFLPTFTMVGLAGAARARFWSVLIPVSIAQTVWVVLTFHFGEAAADWIKPVLQFVSEHLWETTLVAVVLVAIQQFVAYRRRRAAQQDATESSSG